MSAEFAKARMMMRGKESASTAANRTFGTESEEQNR
jgi:hypothetical protein